MNRSALFTLTAAAALGLAFATGSTVARSTSANVPTTVIATVNIQSVFDSLIERKDRLDGLQHEAAGLERGFGTINSQIKQAQDDAMKMPEGPAKEAAIEAAIDRDVQANLEIKKAKNRLEKAQAAAIKALFEKINAAAKASAAKNGYSMVMVADDWVSISPRATSQEATQIMSLRRFLYVAKEHDITADLIATLNADYAATKPAATTAPTTPSPAAPGTATPARN